MISLVDYLNESFFVKSDLEIWPAELFKWYLNDKNLEELTEENVNEMSITTSDNKEPKEIANIINKYWEKKVKFITVPNKKEKYFEISFELDNTKFILLSDEAYEKDGKKGYYSNNPEPHMHSIKK